MISRNASISRSRFPRRHGFTLVEVIIASVIAVFVLSSVTVSLSQLNRARETSQLRLNAHLRADMAMSLIRRDIASTIRHEDLFWTRLLIQSSTIQTPIGDADRDSILVFSTQLRSVHNLDFSGEGMQHEMQYRIEEHGEGAMLWQRRDPVPDEHPLGGGIASPVVEGVISLRFEAFDGYEWWESWDSDEQGLPHAVRVTVVASGARNGNGDGLYDAPYAVLRTVVAIDRVMPPIDTFEEIEIDEEELEDVSDPTVDDRDQEERRRDRRGPDAGPDRGDRDRTPDGRPDAQPRPDAGGRGGGRGGRGGSGRGGQRTPSHIQP